MALLELGNNGQLQEVVGATPITGGLVFSPSSVITAPTLTANTHNLVISGLANGAVLKLQTNGTNYDLTGIDATGIADGATYFVYNVGAAGDIKLKNNNAGSLAGNRIITNGDAVIKDGMGLIITRDASANRWRVNYFK